MACEQCPPRSRAGSPYSCAALSFVDDRRSAKASQTRLSHFSVGLGKRRPFSSTPSQTSPGLARARALHAVRQIRSNSHRQAMAQQLTPTGANGLCPSRRLRLSTPKLIPYRSRVGARNRAQRARRAHVNNARNCAMGKHRARAARLHARAALVCTRDCHAYAHGLARVWALGLPRAERAWYHYTTHHLDLLASSGMPRGAKYVLRLACQTIMLFCRDRWRREFDWPHRQ